MNSNLVIGLTGKNASGKGETSEVLKKAGFSYYSLSDAIRLQLKKDGIEETRENMIATGNKMREEDGPGVLGARIREEVSGNCVIDSIRNPKEVEELQKLDNFKLIAIEADVELRFDRAMKRGRNESASTLEEFKAIENVENSDNPNAQQMNKTISLAHHTLNNNGTLEELHKKVNEYLDSVE